MWAALPTERQVGKTEAAEVSQPQLLQNFASSETASNSFPLMHLETDLKPFAPWI
jgi:hypothetical protein